MSITLDDKAVTSYDEMAIACSNDIEDYTANWHNLRFS